jgi:hypothetical protein
MTQADVAAILARHPHTRDELLEVLRVLPELRSDLDATERTAIDAARAAGLSWHAIAAALGLSSRQAAEQRRLRLEDPPAGRDAARVRQRLIRQRIVDDVRASQLRGAVLRLRNAMDVSPVDYADGPAALARRTVAIATTAPPGALFDLAALIVDDLVGVDLRPSAAAAVRELRSLSAQS